MSAFNTVSTSAPCPQCGRTINVRVQFKYGDTWQHAYKLHDKLAWGGNDVGLPGKRHVVVDGVAETPCPLCGYDDEWNFYVHIKDDEIDQVEPGTGEYDFVAAGRTFLVLSE